MIVITDHGSPGCHRDPRCTALSAGPSFLTRQPQQGTHTFLPAWAGPRPFSGRVWEGSAVSALSHLEQAGIPEPRWSERGTFSVSASAGSLSPGTSRETGHPAFQVPVMEGHREEGRGGGCGPVCIRGAPGESLHLSELGSVCKTGAVMPTASAHPGDRVGRCAACQPGGSTSVPPHCCLVPRWHSGMGGVLCSLPLTLTI